MLNVVCRGFLSNDTDSDGNTLTVTKVRARLTAP